VFLADPAEPTGVGIGALYHTYASKEELLHAKHRLSADLISDAASRYKWSPD
jgi:AcrR family transcriptional regulator